MRIIARSLENLQVEITNHRHRWQADEPSQAGGDDTAPNPFDLLLSALGACKVMTAHMYASRKGWALEQVEVMLDIHEIRGSECDDCRSAPHEKVNVIETAIRFLGDLTPDQKTRLAEIADRCPVHRTLSREILIHTQLVEATPA